MAVSAMLGRTTATLSCVKVVQQCTARSLVTSAAALSKYDIQTVGVVGLGSMGHGVAQLCAQSGYNVIACETSEEALSKGLSAIEKSVKFLTGKEVAKGKITEAEGSQEIEAVLSRLNGQIGVDAATESADLIVEAIVEDLAIKLPLFETLGKHSRDCCILATNTSSFSVTDIAEASTVPQRVVGIHYFNPVQVMRLVEVVKTDCVDAAAIEAVTAFVEKTGKTAVSCGDTPGFIVNRLLVPSLIQGIAMYARGDATMQNIDTAMQLGAGQPMGPLTLSDYIGNDVILAVIQGWVKEYPENPAFQEPEAIRVLEDLCAKGLFGRKSGQGFYKWEGNKVVG
eukprot:m.131703 g.131703  ORF g.131703 m.131703 type:complete len:340 (-) comp17479_c0_seq1:359-1378(-)